jgi:hypothetical protein
MIVALLLKRSALGALAVGALMLLIAAVPASAASSTWWHLTQTTAPASLPTGTEKEVQEIVTSPYVPGVGFAFEMEVNKTFIGFFGTEPYLTFATELTATNLQHALEKAYGSRKVEVTGGPAGKPFYVTTPTRVGKIEVKGEVGSAEAKIVSGAQEGDITITAVNLGDSSVNPSAQPVTIADKLPPGLQATAIEGRVGENLVPPTPNEVGLTRLSCTLATLSCTYAGGEPKELPPYLPIEVAISVIPARGLKSGELNEASISGGGIAAATLKRPLPVGGPVSFGVASYEMSAEEEGGATAGVGGGEPDTQAGSHPFQLTTTMLLNETSPFLTPALAKDLRFNLPPGLIGNPTPVPQCSLADFLTEKRNQSEDLCPAQTAVGVARIRINPIRLIGPGSTVVPLFNLEPAHGEPARFGFVVEDVPVILDTSVRTGGDYGVTVTVANVSQQIDFAGSEVSFWGVPGDPRHNSERGWSCLNNAYGYHGEQCAPFEEVHPSPLLALPTSCTGSLTPTVEADSWADKGVFETFDTTEPMPGMEGCGSLQFQPSITVAPDGHNASTPTGLAVVVHVPQAVSLDAEARAEADVKDTTVTLPEGLVLNPSGGDGLSACPQEEIALDSDAIPGCSEASKVALVRIKTPLLPNELEGEAYLATQNENPFGSLVALYVYAEDPVSGTRVKLAGEVKLNPQTGQLVSTFANTPQLPFEEFEIHFFGGERAPLASPAHCGLYTTQASVTPWSGTRPVTAESTFAIEHGPKTASEPQGGPCPGAALPFGPSLHAGSPNVNAGSFSPLDTTIARADGNQDIQSVQLHMAPGMSGILAGVPLCGEAQANEGTCSPASLIGETTVSAGVGNDPVSVTGGKVYLTEKYAGAPFGLSIVDPVKAGPFDLEHDTANPSQNPPCDCVVVRAKIEVNPTTAALTITTDPSGPHAIPHLIDGIPVQIKAVNVTVNREHFTFNPTNCNPMQITGTIGSDESAFSPISDPFQVTNCGALKFTPKFTVTTSGKTFKARGASLTATVSEPAGTEVGTLPGGTQSSPGGIGSQANIAKVKVELPKQLPSRLTTLQKACTNAQFEANPAACPTASKIGYATVHTPLLPVPLTGPAIFVSHGGEAFPSLTIVLQGYGVTIDLVGTTFISKAGVTSTTFKAVPDQPFSSFTLTLPEGKYSALAANGNLCSLTKTVTVKKKLTVKVKGKKKTVTRKIKETEPESLAMPTEFTGQNGDVIHQTTPISVTGCKASKPAKKATKHKKTEGKKSKRK